MLPIYETWIYRENLIPFLTAVGWVCGYQFDQDDRSAVLNGIKDVSEEDDRWFDYEFRGRSTIIARITMEHGSSSHTIRLQSETDYTREFDVIALFAQSYRIQDPSSRAQA